MVDAAKSDSQSQAKSYWEANPEAAYVNQWTANPIIGDAVYRRMSGGQSAKHWLFWLLEDFFAGQKFENLFSLGCGTGAHEVIIAKSGIVNVIDAFDFSEASLQMAKNNALQAGVEINFYSDDLNTFTVSDDKKYDVAFCSGSLHHVKEIERFLSLVRQHLKPDGYFIVNEYVGDCYNIYNSRQVEIIDRLYQCFPQTLRSRDLEKFKNHTIHQAIAADPSESVRSKLILPFLEQYFDIQVFNPFGGGILHPLYPLLNHNQFMSDDPKSETILRLLLEFESILMDLPSGIETDFCLCILKHKR